MNPFIDKLAYIGVRDGKVLVTRSRGKDVWYLPGGKREAGESDHEALIREVSEELSVTLLPDTIRYYGTFEAPAHGKVDTLVRMTCYMGEFDGEIIPPAEIEEYSYFAYAQKPLTSAASHLIFDDLKTKGLIE
jgi:8-oxo-dGTP diphosphatase